MKTCTFHVSLPGTGRVWRKIEMRADQTLEELHLAIQGAYGWDRDHLYSFFMSGKAWDEATEYLLPEGVPPSGRVIRMEAPWHRFFARQAGRGPGDVRATTLEGLDLEIGQTFMYLFDYGDEWRFKVRVHAVNPDAPVADYPRVVESVGEAPEQYPRWEE